MKLKVVPGREKGSTRGQDREPERLEEEKTKAGGAEEHIDLDFKPCPPSPHSSGTINTSLLRSPTWLAVSGLPSLSYPGPIWKARAVSPNPAPHSGIISG